MKKRSIFLLLGIISIGLGGFFAGILWVIVLWLSSNWVLFFVILGIILVFFGGSLLAIGSNMPKIEIDIGELQDVFRGAKIPEEEITILIKNLDFLLKNFKIEEPEINLIIEGLRTKPVLRKEFLKDYRSIFIED